MPNDDILSFTIWARSTIESDIFVYKPAEWFKVWFFLISKAFWHDGKMLKRGECLFTLAEIAAYTKVTRDQANKCLRWLRESNMIATRKTTRGMRISIVNYAKFQDMGKARRPHEDHTKTTARPQTDYTIEEQENKRTREQGKGEQSSPPAPTPREDAIRFFTDSESRQPVIDWIVAKGVQQELAAKELDKFVAYWTEPTLSGKAQRWEKERAFEIRRRLATWLGRASKDASRFGKTGVQWSSI